ncbi:MAG: DUF4176 domain-containing protein [Lactobacillaceae bacterium]|jgi:hypothetical protein|nr:DUF4176 domain-containing protein [Lactobacillaceae bacterium]
MDNKEFLPLGSIVLLNGSVKKIMIISRAVMLEDNYFDYGAYLYPEGMIDENVIYFNEEDVVKVIHRGFVDDDEQNMVEQIQRAYKEFQNDPQDFIDESVEVDLENNSVIEDSSDPFAGLREEE